MCETEMIHNHVNSIIIKKDFVDYDIETPGKTGKGDGYLSSVVFVRVSGVTRTGEKKILNYVVKIPSPVEKIRELIPISEFFQKEAYIYDKVASAFRNLQNQLGVKEDLLDMLPHCYLTDTKKHQECIILQNLIDIGYGLWNKQQPMSYDHIKLVLETYGKWHALSFALKQKKSGEFKTLVDQNNLNMWSYHIDKSGLMEVIIDFFDEVRHVWRNEKEIAKILNFTRDDVEYFLNDLFFENPEDGVILHGDGWTNNFMFKYENGGQTPSGVCFLDWQLSAVTSPVFDLSYFIYTCVDTNLYPNIRDLLEIYHESLDRNLQLLGCDCSIFPFSRLEQHWKKFSSFGVIMGTFILKFCLSGADEAPDFAEAVELGKSFHEICKFTMANSEMYYKRSKDNFLHYVRNSK